MKPLFGIRDCGYMHTQPKLRKADRFVADYTELILSGNVFLYLHGQPGRHQVTEPNARIVVTCEDAGKIAGCM